MAAGTDEMPTHILQQLRRQNAEAEEEVLSALSRRCGLAS
jgi:hypothetical protein